MCFLNKHSGRFRELPIDDLVGSFANTLSQTIATNFNLAKYCIASRLERCHEFVSPLIIIEAIPNYYGHQFGVGVAPALESPRAFPFDKISLKATEPLNLPTKIDNVFEKQPFYDPLGLDELCDLSKQTVIKLRILDG